MEARRPADYSVVHDGRLVALVFRGGPGALRRPGREPLVELAWAEIEIFDPRHTAKLTELAQIAESLDEFLFKLKLDEFRVEVGEVKPTANWKRF